MAIKANQCGVDEVFQASQKDAPDIRINDSKVFDYIPRVGTAEGMNNTPMFQIRKSDGKVCRRKELNDLQCKLEPIDDWTAAGTLSKLDRSKPENPGP